RTCPAPHGRRPRRGGTRRLPPPLRPRRVTEAETAADRETGCGSREPLRAPSPICCPRKSLPPPTRSSPVPCSTYPTRSASPHRPPLAPLWCAAVVRPAGPYRVIYLINDASRVVEVTATRHRKDAYLT